MDASVELVKQLLPSVVHIHTEIPASHPSTAILGDERMGTGTIVDPAGLILTVNYVVMGGQAGVRDHVHIGNRAILTAMAGITNSVPDGTVMMGVPATPEREQKLKLAAAAKLPEMRKEFKAMRRAIADLEKAVGLTPTKLHDADQAA